MKFLRKVLNKEGFSGNSENVSEILLHFRKFFIFNKFIIIMGDF